MGFVGRCEVVYFDVVLHDIFSMNLFRCKYRECDVYLFIKIWELAVCTGGLIGENTEGAVDGFDCLCTIS